MSTLSGTCSHFLLLQTFGLVFLSGIVSVADAASKCHSCFSACRNASQCDCASSDTCEGEYCYVKLDRSTGAGVGAIQKGCANWAPGGYVDVCQYVSNNSSAECYCKGDSCNNAAHFKNYQIQPLPLVSCCQCDGYNYENDTIDCLPDSCLRNCTGHYCYNDIVRQSQGCGWGHSFAWQFLRNADRPGDHNSTSPLALPWAKDGGDMTCTEAYSDTKTFIRGCTCAENFCNMQDTANFYVRNETEERESSEHYCYAVHVTSDKPITGDAFQQSTTCPGHFCFVSLSTVALDYSSLHENASARDGRGVLNSSFVDRNNLPKLATRYELTAGCVLVDDEKKVKTGCTVEWSVSEKRPTKKHCICASHICNYFNLITGEDSRSLLAFDWKTSADYKTVSSALSQRSASLWTSASVVLALRLKRHLTS